MEKSKDELLEKSKDAEESGTESAASESDDPEAVNTALDAIELEGGLEAVKERIRLLKSLVKQNELEENPCDWKRIAIVQCKFMQPGFRPGEGYFEDLAEFIALATKIL